MAEADCALCWVSGYRSCDGCSGPVFPDYIGLAPGGLDLCGYCLPADLLPLSDSERD